MAASNGPRWRGGGSRRVGGEDQGEILLGETSERCCVTEGPIDPFHTVEAGELNRLGHLHFDPRRSGGGALDQPQTGAFTEGEELGLGRVPGFGLAVERPCWARRIMGHRFVVSPVSTADAVPLPPHPYPTRG